MADKSQNIFINWKSNTAEIDKAAQTLNRVNQLSNDIQKNAGEVGKKTAAGMGQATKSIALMELELKRLTNALKGSTNAQGTKFLSEQYRKLKGDLDAATKSAFGLNTELQKQGGTAQSLTGKFGQLYGAVQTVIGAAVIRQVANMTLEFAKLAGNAEGIRIGFERAFPDSLTVLNQLREATRGTVSDMELMQRTLQATNLGVAIKELPVLFEFAAARAQQTGESVDYLVDSIVRGIGRKSPLILDNLGLSATRLKEKFDGAALASQSVADVTRGVAEIAREELEKMGGFIETGAVQVAQLEAAWENLRVTFAKRIDSSGIINFFKEAFEGMTAALKTEKELETERIKNRAAIELESLKENQLAEQRIENGKKIKQTQQELVDATQAEIRERMKLIEAGKVEALIIKQKFDLASHTANGTAAEINANIKIREQLVQQGLNVQRNVKFYEETVKLLRQFNDQLNANNEVEVKSGIVERKKAEIKTIQDQIEKSNNALELGGTRLSATGEVIQGTLIKKLEIAQAELGDLTRAFFEFKPIEFKEQIDGLTDSLSNFGDASSRIAGQLADIAKTGVQRPDAQPESFYEPDTWQLLKDDFVANWRDITTAGIDIQADQLKSLAQMELDNMQLRLSNIQEFYSHQQELAGDNEVAKDQLRKKEARETTKLRNEIARKEKQVRKTQVIIDIASGIAKAFATYPWPYSLIPAAFVAAQGVAQLAIINRQPTNFAEGSPIGIKGPGTEKSDSIPANLSRGETVMSALETRNAGNVLKEIRAKTLDNKKLRELKQGRAPIPAAPIDTQGIIKAIKGQKPPDVTKISNIVYEVKQHTDEYKKRVRSRSMGI